METPGNTAPETQQGREFRADGRRAAGLPPDVLKQLYQLSFWPAMLGVIETLGVLAAAIAVSLVWWTPWVVAPMLVVICSRQQACFVLAHDAAHYRLFAQRWLNDLVGCLVAIPVGISMRTYRVVHRLHHNHLYESRDPDIPLHGGYPRGRAYLAKKLLRDLTGATAPKTYAYFFGAPAINDDATAVNRPLDDTAPELRRAARIDRWWVVGFHVAAPIAAYAGGYLLEYLVLWLLPLVTLLQALLRLRAICEHGAVSDTTSPLLAARSNTGPGWLIWLMFPHSVNYHIEHHLYPAIPFYNLPRAHAEMQARGLLQGAEVRDIRDTLRRIFAERPKQAKPAQA
jgi:fatty acid desaturase